MMAVNGKGCLCLIVRKGVSKIPDFNEKDYWRSIILYGLNVATYKIALGKVLFGFAENGITSVSWPELSEKFFDVYLDRLSNEMPQLNQPGRLTVMERVVQEYQANVIDRGQAVDRVVKDAFGDVIPRFHKLGGIDIPVKFYDANDAGLIITDSLHEVFGSLDIRWLEKEIMSRWDLLEAAFAQKRDNWKLVNDVRKIYLQNAYARKPITENIPVLNGYQLGQCFYCGEEMPDDRIHVDHLIARQLVQHDEVWNLVLAHDICNELKSDMYPPREYVSKLIERNEYFILSNHPIKNKLIATLGRTVHHRKRFIDKVYNHAKTVLLSWEGVRGYNPGTDRFYKRFVREFVTV